MPEYGENYIKKEFYLVISDVSSDEMMMMMIKMMMDEKMEIMTVIIIRTYHTVYVGRDSSVGMATRYGLDGPWIESRCGRHFPHVSRPAVRPTQPPIQGVPDLSRR